MKNQREQPRVFYSLREVAQQFKVPISTVAKVYSEMEQEGVLSRVRGSKTILNGLRPKRKLSVRAFVGLPTLTSNFIAIQDFRTFLISLRQELWLRGFAATIFFFRPSDLANGTLVGQLKDYKVDSVIWFHPGRTAMETFLRLADMGIRVIVISEVGTPTMPSRYFVWKEHAIAALLQQWKDRNLADRVMLVNSKGYRSPVTEEIVRVILQSFGIEPVIRSFQDEDSSVFLRDLCHVKASRIIFPAAGLVSRFAFRSPDQMTDLMKAQRLALVDGPTDMPFAQVPDGAVDVVMVNWQAVSESIVNDLITGAAFDRNRHTTFDAEARLDVPLRSICEEILPTRSIGSSE
jgi:hypothetical protein